MGVVTIESIWSLGFLALLTWTLAYFLIGTCLLPTGWDKLLELIKGEDDNKKLARIWRESREGVVFASIVVHAWDLDHRKITDIGISIWWPRTSSELDMSCHHWQIEENKVLQNTKVPNEPDTFAFGATRVISEAEIAACLDDLFGSLVTLNRIILVGHDVHSILKLLRKYWKPPRPTTFLDTQKIWQVQNQKAESTTLAKALDMTSAIGYNTYLLNNAGNDARLTLHLLQAQGHTLVKDEHEAPLDSRGVIVSPQSYKPASSNFCRETH
ncbi:hypothetical protein GGS26DRAFT_598997 [Hypomontagnella submonticulosa]|nr:hypothetical protein GGS26DRAFT_598997 [Hypomontagnella submonticulosa]